jgi:hypothetical protein
MHAEGSNGLFSKASVSADLLKHPRHPIVKSRHYIPTIIIQAVQSFTRLLNRLALSSERAF